MSDDDKIVRGSKWTLLLGAFYLIVALQVATQVAAWDLKYHPALGFNIAHWYPFWGIVTWDFKWYHALETSLRLGETAGMFVIAVLFGCTILWKVNFSNEEKKSDIYGSSRFAEKKDIIDAGLLPQTKKDRNRKDMVICGGWIEKTWWGKKKFHLLRHSGAEHILMVAPTRSGKGVSVVIPSLLTWRESLVVTDLKGELWACTSGWRKKIAGNKVLKFEPASTNSVKWNPLDSIRIGPNEVGDAQNIATLIVDPDGKGLEDHWAKTAFALMTAVILFLMHEDKTFHRRQATLPKVLETLSMAENKEFVTNDKETPVNLWDAMQAYENDSYRDKVDVGTCSTISQSAKDILSAGTEERPSIISTAKTFLALYRDPVVAENVSHSDFKVTDLNNYKDPVSLYIVTQPNDKDRLRPLVRIAMNGIMRRLADKMKFIDGRAVGDYKHRVLMMIDEFPSLGRLPIIEESLAFVAGYGIKCFLICQDMTQLKDDKRGYGQNESITSNCHIQIVLAPNRVDTAEIFSKMMGKRTIVKSEKNGNTTRQNYYARDLMTPDELRSLKKVRFNKDGSVAEYGEMIIFVAGTPAIRGSQPLYFVDKHFSPRSKIPAPETSDKLESADPFAEAGDVA